MKCYYHPTEPAVGTCKACSKGLCLECAADLGHGIACKNKHEQRVEDIEFMISKNIKAFRTVKKFPLNGVLFSGAMGLVFGGYGLFGRAEITWFTTMLGAVFLVFALVALLQNRAVWSEK